MHDLTQQVETFGDAARGRSSPRQVAAAFYDLDETGRMVCLADGLHQLPAGQDALLQRLAPQVQVAVLETQRLIDIGIGVVDEERRRACLGQHRDLVGAQLHLAGGQLGVLGAFEALGDGAADP